MLFSTYKNNYLRQVCAIYICKILLFLLMKMDLNFSAYLNDLKTNCPEAATRYMDKIKKIKCDPYTLTEEDFDYGIQSVPPITNMDIVSYLVLTHSFYTKEQMKAYKSLTAYKYFDAGFVDKVGCKNMENLVLLVGKVSTFFMYSLILFYLD